MRDLFTYAGREGATKLFAAVYGLEITFLFMEMDIGSVGGIHNLHFAPGRRHEKSLPLLDDAAFAGKMDTLLGGSRSGPVATFSRASHARPKVRSG